MQRMQRLARTSRISLVLLTLGNTAVATLPATVSRTPYTTLIVSVGDAMNGAFIADAEVRLPSLGRTARTKWDGEASFAGLSPGQYRVQVRAVGYAPADIDAQLTGDSIGIHFELERIPSALDTVRVVGTRTLSPRLQPFEARRRDGIGRFLTDSILADDKTRSLRSVLVSHFGGITFKDRGIVSTQPSGLMGDNECPVLVYLDGMQMENVDRTPLRVAPQSGRRGGAGPQPKERVIPDLESMRPEEFAGVELYSRSTAPQEYRPLGNYCKVLLLWSK